MPADTDAVMKLLLPLVFLAACSDGLRFAGGPNQLDNELTTPVDRPPQFVLLAFDGSLSLPFWEESRTFAKDLASKGVALKWTYFMSGPYFLKDSAKLLYHGPGRKAGASDIGFGGNDEAVAARFAQATAAYNEGHEIGSHANGHFDGSKWSEADWTSEFNQFDTLIFDARTTNALPDLEIGFPMEAVVGFRAPLLGYNAALYQSLTKHHFVYDTSQVADPKYWPELQNGVWNFPLALLRIVGSGKKTLSMDYNFYMTQSKGVRDPDTSHHAIYEKQMFDTYMQYFETNYTGNRAPVHIGHHFSKWNGGAYWRALQRFAEGVCAKPEVQCVTYTELVRFMNDNAGKRASFAAGNFPKLGSPVALAPEAIDDSDDSGLTLHAAHSDDDDAPLLAR